MNPTLVTTLVVRVQELYGPSPSDLERMCWTVVHEHHHGTMPSEYDIREVDEDLYLAVLTAARS
ncbi:hypothetical protein [Synechococcus sp. MIT S9508]|uniref:hypothetical protein n=1 Tax=Synechococcus sp. MIT S9508 TaxID=1801629 RepID=UPI001E361B91|nr:hypothetical protein [Synechococcus sp. MIT S9508]